METRVFDFGLIVQFLPDLLSYLDVTLLVAGLSIVIGSLLGGLLAWANLSGSRVLRACSLAYVYVMRCTPSIVLLFIVFYGAPKLVFALFDYDMNAMHRAVFAVVTFTLLFGAYISAAVSAGLSPWQAFCHVMLGQAALIALPNFGNSTINLLKEASLAYTIGLIDLIGRGNLIIAQNYGAYGVEVYLSAMLIYWGLVLLIEQGFAWAEHRLDQGTGLRAASAPKTLGNELKGGNAIGTGS
ncbi:MAG: amino acid ABC transporter permease [Selenomonas sp.]|nr:amino acid ABC transporter permease [Selenomonas sp.]